MGLITTKARLRLSVEANGIKTLRCHTQLYVLKMDHIIIGFEHGDRCNMACRFKYKSHTHASLAFDQLISDFPSMSRKFDMTPESTHYYFATTTDTATTRLKEELKMYFQWWDAIRKEYRYYRNQPDLKEQIGLEYIGVVARAL